MSTWLEFLESNWLEFPFSFWTAIVMIWPNVKQWQAATWIHDSQAISLQNFITCENKLYEIACIDKLHNQVHTSRCRNKLKFTYKKLEKKLLLDAKIKLIEVSIPENRETTYQAREQISICFDRAIGWKLISSGLGPYTNIRVYIKSQYIRCHFTLPFSRQNCGPVS